MSAGHLYIHMLFVPIERQSFEILTYTLYSAIIDPFTSRHDPKEDVSYQPSQNADENSPKRLVIIMGHLSSHHFQYQLRNVTKLC